MIMQLALSFNVYRMLPGAVECLCQFHARTLVLPTPEQRVLVRFLITNLGKQHKISGPLSTDFA
jgi:hypothetical protein